MRDPLQTQESPYEILQVDRNADTDEIGRAFKTRLAQAKNVQVLQRARMVLTSPDQRAMVNMFLYDRGALERLLPSPIQDTSVLTLAERATTGAAWEKTLKASFPEIGAVHSLAVFWYWWAVAATENATDADPASRGSRRRRIQPWSVDEMWRRAIANWVMLANTQDFWKKQRVGPDQALRLGDLVMDRIRGHLRTLGTATGTGRQLEILLTTEARTAKAIGSSKVRNTNGRLSCGRLMLEHVGLLETVRNQLLQEASQKGRGSKNAASVLEDLSPYAAIAAEIRLGRPDAALAAIKELSRADRSTDEVVVLSARAFNAIGKQQASVGEFDQALASWKAALKGDLPASLANDISSEVAAACQSGAAALQVREPDRAIDLLDAGLRLVKDDGIQDTLAELLTQRGVNMVIEAQKRMEGGGSGGANVSALEGGQKLLKRASRLGSTRAKEQLKPVKDLIELTLSGLYDLSEKAKQHRQAAIDAATKAEAWELAVTEARKAASATKGRAGEVLTKELANYLANCGIMKANKGVAMMEEANSAYNSRVSRFMDQLAPRTSQPASNPVNPLIPRSPVSPPLGGLATCRKCGRRQVDSPYENWYTITHPTVGPASLCESCTREYQSFGTPPRPSRAAYDLVKSGRADLDEAAKLDPESKYAKNNLKQVEKTFKQVENVGVDGGGGVAGFFRGIFQ